MGARPACVPACPSSHRRGRESAACRLAPRGPAAAAAASDSGSFDIQCGDDELAAYSLSELVGWAEAREADRVRQRRRTAAAHDGHGHDDGRPDRRRQAVARELSRGWWRVRRMYRSSLLWDWKLRSVGLWSLALPCALALPAYREFLWQRLLNIGAAVFVWGYSLAFAYSARPPNEDVKQSWKVFVYQPGLIKSRMDEAYVWTWLALMQASWFIVLELASLYGFHEGSPLPGSRFSLWVLPLYCFAFPCSVPWSAVSSSTAFKKAAAASYPGVIFMHEGYWGRMFFMMATLAIFPVLWVLIGPDGVLGTWEYHMCLLYLTAAYTLLCCFWVFPRCANLVKDSSALEQLRASQAHTITDVEWSLGNAISHQVLNMGMSARTSISTMFRSAKIPPKTTSDRRSKSRDGGPAKLRSSRSMDDRRPVMLDPNFLALARTSVHANLRQPLADTAETIRAPPSILAMELDSKQQHTSKLVGWGESLPGTPNCEITPGGPQPMCESVHWSPSLGHRVSDDLDDGVAGRYNGIPASAANSIVDLFAQSGPSRASSEPPSDVTQSPLKRAAQASARSLLAGLSAVKKVSVRNLPSALTGTDNWTAPLAGRGRRATTNSQDEIRGRPFSITGQDMTMAKAQASMILSGVISTLRAEPFYSATFRHTQSTGRVILRGLIGLPGGLRSMAVNVSRAGKLVVKEWRMFLARTPQKTLYSAAFLMGSPLGWASIKFGLTDGIAGKTIDAISFAIGLLFFFISCGWMLRADHDMIIKGAESGQLVGSGLVFSVTELLEALQFGLPLPAGYIATEERVLESAAISCRWDAAPWELPVKDVKGRPRACHIRLSHQQLYRATLVAFYSRAKYLWMDTLSLPQQNESDSEGMKARKKEVLRNLLPTMTSVYGSAKVVLVVETELGMEDSDNAYHRRSWTLQECVLNKNTKVVHLNGDVTVLGSSPTRERWSGLTLDADFLTGTLDSLDSYGWLVAGKESMVARELPMESIRNFRLFANSRTAYTSSDKAIALGQTYFRMLFPTEDSCHTFMQELAFRLALDTSDEVSRIVDNRGWDPSRMTGSADPRRFLTGRPCQEEKGEAVTWRLNCSWKLKHRIRSVMDDPTANHRNEEWICKLQYSSGSGSRFNIPAVVIPGPCLPGGCRSLLQLRTCSVSERLELAGAGLACFTDVTWY